MSRPCLYPALNADRLGACNTALLVIACSPYVIIGRTLDWTGRKLITATAFKTPQKPVALIVSQVRDQQSDKIWDVFGCEGGKAVVAASSSVDTSPSPVRSELEWCRPFSCKGTVKIDGVIYPVPILSDSRILVAQKGM